MFYTARPNTPTYYSPYSTMNPYHASPYTPARYGAEDIHYQQQLRRNALARQREAELARAAAIRAQQRREYEHQLALRARQQEEEEEEEYLRYLACAQAREDSRRRQAELLRQRRNQQVEERLRGSPKSNHSDALRHMMNQFDSDEDQGQDAHPAAPSNTTPSHPGASTAAKPTDQPPIVSSTSPVDESTTTHTSPNPVSQSGSLSPARGPSPSPPVLTGRIQKPSMVALDRILSTFTTLTSSFTLPTLDFSSSPSTSSHAHAASPTTHVPFNSTNRPLHAYEAALGQLLNQLDAVESDGDMEVRARRKELVRQVEQALRELDEAVEAQRQTYADQGQDLELPSAPESESVAEDVHEESTNEVLMSDEPPSDAEAVGGETSIADNLPMDMPSEDPEAGGEEHEVNELLLPSLQATSPIVRPSPCLAASGDEVVVLDSDVNEVDDASDWHML